MLFKFFGWKRGGCWGQYSLFQVKIIKMKQKHAYGKPIVRVHGASWTTAGQVQYIQR